VAVFLNGSVAVASSPEIVFVVDYAAVSRIRRRFPVAEAAHNFAIGIELDEAGPAGRLQPPWPLCCSD
jgi:hypothetical protein